MAKYFRVTIGTQLISTFKVVYSTESSPTIFNHTAEIYNESNNSYSTATGLTYDQLTDNGGAIVRTDDDVYQIKIEDENGYCNDCTSEEYGTIPSNSPSTSTITIENIYQHSGGSTYPVSNTYSGTLPQDYTNLPPGNYPGEYYYQSSSVRWGYNHIIRNNSSSDLYIRLQAFTFNSGNKIASAYAHVIFSQGATATDFVIDSTNFGGNTIIPSGTVTSTNPAYSSNYWTLNRNGGVIVFGIHPAYYQTDSVSYRLAWQDAALGTNITSNPPSTSIGQLYDPNYTY